MHAGSTSMSLISSNSVDVDERLQAPAMVTFDDDEAEDQNESRRSRFAVAGVASSLGMMVLLLAMEADDGDEGRDELSWSRKR